MKVATRITVATAIVVMIASATYAYFDLRGRALERRAALDREARALAGTLRGSLEDQAAATRATIEATKHRLAVVEQAIEGRGAVPAAQRHAAFDNASGLPAPARTLLDKAIKQAYELTDEDLVAAKASALNEEDAFGLVAAAALGQATRQLDAAAATASDIPGDRQLAELSRANGHWRVNVLPRARGAQPPGGDASPAQLQRLNTLLEVPELCDRNPAACAGIEGDSFFLALPLRGPPPPRTAVPAVIGMLEITRSADVLSATGDDLARAAALVVLIVIVTTVMVGVLASRLVSRPITKLLSGIDDVAKGDLSHVILSERDDEIGQIATRFNDMTYSLRESRGETQRQNEAKLALEQRLGQTEKLATIGQLAAEIAHEVGTPLNVIAGRARAIQRKAKDPDVVEKNAEIVAEQTARITRIIQRLLDFTRRKVGTAGKGEVNVNELSLTTMELLAGQFSSAKIRTRLDRADGLPRVAGDADRLQQVMINLLLNAAQAMPDGGSLVVETKAVRRARPGLEGGAEQAFVTFSVMDTGVGIPAEIKEKIFDPFYTTKEGQGGTGLGLAVCSGIVKEHDGWIDVEDGDSGAGTTFRVYLPA